jgi:hypothetical protein
MKRLILSSLFIILFAGILYSANGTPSTLIVRTDANNALIATAVTQTNPITQGVFSSRTLRTDANNALQVILTGTVTPTYPQAIPASTCASPSLGLSGSPTTGIAFTATPSILECISGTAVETLTATTNTMIVSELINRGTITTDLKVRDDTVTWNNAGVTFTGWKLNVTNTNSNSASLLLDLQVGGTTQFNVTRTGVLTVATQLTTAANGVVSVGSNGGFALATNFALNANPSIGSGFGTSPSVAASNRTAAFTINVGTGGTATGGVVTMPAATTGWNCQVVNRTALAAARANQSTTAGTTWQTATTTTSVTVTNINLATGGAVAWTASDILAFHCLGY